MDLFREVKEKVPVMEAARRYGFEPDRQGKIRCPFHDDSHPSLQLYKGARGWWCYVCISIHAPARGATAKLNKISVKFTEIIIKTEWEFKHYSTYGY